MLAASRLAASAVLAVRLAAAPAAAADSRPAVTAVTETAGGSTRSATADSAAAIDAAAAYWRLTPAEYRRYRELIEGLRGRLSDPGITPVEVLGIEATDAAARRRYAEQWVRMIHADTEKVLAYSREVYEAWQRLYPEATMVDLERVNALRARHGSAYPPIRADRPAAGIERLLVFTRIGGCRACDDGVLKVVAQVAAGGTPAADLYVLDATPGKDDARIRAWARSLAIPPQLVEQGTVTLNYDGGTLHRVSEQLGMTPAGEPVVIVRHADGRYVPGRP
jgi:integrating conjugative element protein (TIGR03759 family)